MILILYRNLSAPISVQIELTTQCPNNCPHCYNYQRQDDEPDIAMSIEEIRRTFDVLKTAKVFSITLTGGEPLIRPNLVFEGIRLSSEKGISCSINSNLTLLTEEMIVKMTKAGGFGILTSIASHDEATHDAMMGKKGAFKKTLRGIELLKKYDIGFSVNMVITKMNASQVFETGIFAHRLGARSFSATKASPPLGCGDYSAIQPTFDQVKSSLDDLLRLQKETGISVDILECYPLCFFKDLEKYKQFANHSCSAGITSGTIGPDGQLRPCSHSNRIYGNIFEEDITVAYSRMTEWRSGELLPEKCLTCTYFGMCSGGCRCEAEHAGNIKGMDPFALDQSYVLRPKKEIKIKDDINPESKISVDPRVMFREEEFGYILWANKSVSFVDKEAGILLQKLQVNEMTLVEAAIVSGAEVEKISDVLNCSALKKMINFRYNPAFEGMDN